MRARRRFVGDWKPGITNQFVDIKALDIFLRVLPWALAVEAIVRGWEMMRITGMLLNMQPSSLRGQVAESAFGFEFFGLLMFLSGLLMVIGLSIRRFIIIITASLTGSACYFLLSLSFFVEAFTGNAGVGARGGITFLIITGLWVFKGFFSSTKKTTSDLHKEAAEQAEGTIQCQK